MLWYYYYVCISQLLSWYHTISQMWTLTKRGLFVAMGNEFTVVGTIHIFTLLLPVQHLFCKFLVLFWHWMLHLRDFWSLPNVLSAWTPWHTQELLNKRIVLTGISIEKILHWNGSILWYISLEDYYILVSEKRLHILFSSSLCFHRAAMSSSWST